jgi:hypothetical protein
MGDWDCGGAEAPADLHWQIGKTAGSIRFVRKAEEVMRVLSTGPVHLEILKFAVEAVKAGKLIVADDELNPQGFTYL